MSQSHASVRAGPGSTARYRLRGEVAGGARVFPLAPGENQIGSVAGNTIVLGVRGVSRHHARLTLDADALTLEDLGSKNGTMANGVRIQRTRLVPGDEVRIGPVLLRLEAVDAADTDLAIILSHGETPALVGLPAKDTTAVSAEKGGGGEGLAGALVEALHEVLEVMEGVLARLAVRPTPDLKGALGVLRRELGAQGASFFELTRTGTVILASSGEGADLSLHRGLQDFARSGAGSTAAAVSAGSFEGQVPLACALRRGPGDRLGIALWGKLRLGRGEIERVLRVVLNLAELFRPSPLHESRAQPGARSLVFPEGYVPGDSTAMTSLYEQMKSLLQGDLPVLLLGETGVGKEFLAGILHASSARRSGPFVAVNCAAIPAELLESEMFGIRKGTATGVVERTGSFQRASGGTLFLDEIGEMPLALQAKLLRAVQEKQVQPVGGEPAAVDIRVIAATNSDLQQRMDAGLFRRDLYYRVAGFVLRVPALRERKEDVDDLVLAFTQGFARETGKAVRGVTQKALQTLKAYGWPGNVRELQHEVRRLVYLCPDGQALESSMISEHILLTPHPVDPVEGEMPASLDLEANLGRLESRLIREALGRAGGNRTQAARLLGISRNGLAIKMERLGIKD